MEKNELNNQELISLMDVYLNEFSFRSSLIWSHGYKLFYATIVVIFLPYIQNFLNMSDLAFPNFVFNIVGFVMTFTLLYVTIGYEKRSRASALTYNKIINLLDEKYRRKPFEPTLIGKIPEIRTGLFLIWVMFISLMIINALVLFNNLQ